MQETKWTGKSARKLREGFKKSSRNGVAVMLSPEFKEKVVEVTIPSDRLNKLKLMIAGELFNIASAYAPQSGEVETIKDEFWKD